MDWNGLLQHLLDLATTVGIKMLVAAIVLFVGHKLIKILRKWILTTPGLCKLDGGVRSFLSSFAKIALYIILFITVAMILGIPTTSFITALASCGVAIGLAMQGSLSNFAGGIMILMFKPFKVGDFIQTPDASGKVEEITVVYTILSTADNKRVTIPNGTLTNSVIENFSANKTRRVDINFEVDYRSDEDTVLEILKEAIKNHPKILSEPEPFARMTMQNQNTLTFTTRAWCNSEDYFDVNFDLSETIRKEFKNKNIEIPKQKVDLYVER